MPIRPVPRTMLMLGGAVLTCGSLVSTRSAHAEGDDDVPYLCEWQPVEGARYYDGAIGTAGKDADAVRFRTTDTWVILSGPCHAVSLTARDAAGAPVGPREFKPTSAGPLAPAKAPTEPPPAQPEVTPPQAEPSFQPEDYEKEEEGYYDDEPPGSVAGSGSDHASGTAQRALHLATTLWLGVGKEWVAGKSGVTEFDGSAHIGGTGVEARWLGRAPTLYGVAKVAAHRFRTVVEESEGSVGQPEEREAKVLRLAARIGLLHAFSPAQPAATAPLVALGGGVEYRRLPVLALADDDAGTARIDAASVFGPWVGGVAELGMGADDVLGLGADAAWAAGWGKARATVLTVDTHWRHDLTPSLAADGAVAYERAEIKAPVDCDGRQSCTSHGKTTSAVAQLRLGVGWRW